MNKNSWFLDKKTSKLVGIKNQMRESYLYLFIINSIFKDKKFTGNEIVIYKRIEYNMNDIKVLYYYWASIWIYK